MPTHFATTVAPILYCGTAVAWLAGTVFNRNQNALSMVIAFYFTIFVAVPAVLQIRWQHFPFKTEYSQADLMAGFGCLALAHIPFSLVALLGKRGGGIAPAATAPGSPAQFSNRDTWPYLALCLLGLVGLSILGIIAAGPQSFLQHRFSEGGEADGAGQVKFIVRSMMVVAATIVAALFRYGRPSLRQPTLQWLSLATITIFLFTHYPPALARFSLLGAFLAVAIVLFPLRTARQKLSVVLGGAFFLIYVFHGIKYIGEPDKMVALIRDQGTEEYLTTVDFDSFQQVVNTWLYHSQGWSRPWDSLLGTLFFWVPRSLWSSKPSAAGSEVTEALGYYYTNVASPLPAEALAAAGLPGIVGVCALVAIAVSWVEGRYLQVQDSGTLLIPLYAVSAGFATIILRGSLTATVPMFGTAILLSVAIIPGFHLFQAAVLGRSRPQPFSGRAASGQDTPT